MTAPWFYAPGEWFAIARGAVLVLLPPSTPSSAVRDAWRALESGAVDRLALLRLVGEGTGDAALVVDVSAEGEATLLLRGDGEALRAVDQEAHATTWTQDTLGPDDPLQLRVAGHEGEPDLPLVAGVVRAGALERAEATALLPASGTVPAAAAGRGFAPDPADPQSRRDQNDAAARPRVRLHLSTGESLEVTGPVLIGRAPSAPAGEDARLVSVTSPRGTIARTHARVEVHGAGLLVTDLATTNGVLVRHPRRLPFRPEPGIATEVGHGAVVDLGEAVSFRVEVSKR